MSCTVLESPFDCLHSGPHTNYVNVWACLRVCLHIVFPESVSHATISMFLHGLAHLFQLTHFIAAVMLKIVKYVFPAFQQATDSHLLHRVMRNDLQMLEMCLR